MGKFTFWGHTKHFVTLIGSNPRRVLHKTVGEQLAHSCCSDLDKPCLYHPLIHPHVVTFCSIRLSQLSWAFMNGLFIQIKAEKRRLSSTPL